MILNLASRCLRLAATALALACSTTYAAADGIPGVVMTDSQYLTDWSGVYLGGKLGGAWADLNWSQDANIFTAGAVPPNASADFSPSGVAGGIIGGANLQLGQWIFGAELSFSGTDLSQQINSPFFPATDTFSTELNWLATVEGRIGYSWDHVMVFGKGGWAGANASLTLVRSTNGATASTDEFVDGWTLGAGIEYACWSSVIIGLEYDYVSLSLTSASSCPLCDAGIVAGSGPSLVTGDATISSVMVRASYLFAPED